MIGTPSNSSNSSSTNHALPAHSSPRSRRNHPPHLGNDDDDDDDDDDNESDGGHDAQVPSTTTTTTTNHTATNGTGMITTTTATSGTAAAVAPTTTTTTTTGTTRALDVPLMRAVVRGQVEKAMQLMERHQVYTCYGDSVLHCACRYGQIGLVRAIFERGWEKHMQASTNGQSLLQEAASTTYCYKQNKIFKEMLDLLRSKDTAIVSHVDRNGNNVFHTIALALTDFYVNKPEAVTDYDDFGKIMDKYFYEVVRLMEGDNNAIDKQLDKKNVDGQTPLMIFAMGGSSYAVNILCKKFRAAPNVVDNQGETALHLIVQQPFAFQRKAFKTLVDLLQPDFGATSSDGNTVLQDIGCVLNENKEGSGTTYENERHAFVSYLNDLWSIASERKIIKAFNVDNQDNDGDTALMGFAEGSYVEGVRILVEGFGAKVSIKNKNGETALSIARDPKIKEILMKKLEEEHRSSSLESVEVVVQSSPESAAMSASSSDASASALAGRSTASVRNTETSTKPVLSAPTASPAATSAATTSVVATTVSVPVASATPATAATQQQNKHNVGIDGTAGASSVSTTTTTTIASSSSSSLSSSSSSSSSSGKRKRAAESDEEGQSVAAPISPTKRAKGHSPAAASVSTDEPHATNAPADEPIVSLPASTSTAIDNATGSGAAEAGSGDSSSSNNNNGPGGDSIPADVMAFLTAKFSSLEKEMQRFWKKLLEVDRSVKLLAERR